MPVSKAPWLAGGIAALSVALVASGLLLACLDRHLVPASETNWDPVDVLSALSGVAVAVITSVIAARRPANPIGWLGLTAAFIVSLVNFATSYGLRGGVVAPGSLLPAWHAAMWLVNAAWSPSTAALAFVFLLFPTGRLRSRRPRRGSWPPSSARTPLGAGLRNMTDRLAALGGSLQLRSAPGHGTTIAGRLPVTRLDPGTTGPRVPVGRL